MGSQTSSVVGDVLVAFVLVGCGAAAYVASRPCAAGTTWSQAAEAVRLAVTSAVTPAQGGNRASS